MFAVAVVHRQFGGYDLSPVIDLVWRMKQGQVPGVDFITTLPMSLMLLGKSISGLSPSWFDLTYANVAFTLFAWGFFALHGRVFLRDPFLALLTPLILSIALLYTNHIWHASVSQILAAMLVFSVYSAVTQPGPRRIALTFVASALLVGAKQNIAPSLLAITLLWLIVAGARKNRPIIAALIAGAVVGLACYLAALGMSVSTFLYGYTAVSGRLIPDPEMIVAVLQVRSNQLLIPLGLAALGAYIVAYRWNSERHSVRAYLLACLIVSLVPVLTDWDSKLNDISLPLFILVLQTSTYRGVEPGRDDRMHFLPEPPTWSRTAATVTLLVILVAIWGGWNRERMQGVGPFFEPVTTNTVQGGYFGGLSSGPWFAGILAEVDTVGRAFPDERVFFGPRMEFGYTVLGAASPRGLPLWWHPGSSYAIRDTDEIAQAFVADRFDVLVFAHDVRTRMPGSVLTIVDREYEPVPGFVFLDVFKRKAQPPLGADPPILVPRVA